MDVRLAVLADCANVAVGGKLNLMGIFSELHAATFPVVHPVMVLAMRLEFTFEDAGNDQELAVRVIDEDGRELLAVTQRISVSRVPPGDHHYLDRTISISGVVIERPGALAFRVFWNGRECAKVPLRIRKVGPAG